MLCSQIDAYSANDFDDLVMFLKCDHTIDAFAAVRSTDADVARHSAVALLVAGVVGADQG